MDRPDAPPVRRATIGDARVIAQLLHDFNREFDEPTPPVVELEHRIAQLLQGDDTVVLLVGKNPDGLAVLRLRDALWSAARRRFLVRLGLHQLEGAVGMELWRWRGVERQAEKKRPRPRWASRLVPHFAWLAGLPEEPKPGNDGHFALARVLEYRPRKLSRR